MHIALGYAWFVTAAGFHLERAFRDLGHQVSYVGLPAASRPGWDSSLRVDEIVAALPNAPSLYLWVDPAGRYFPAGIEDLAVPTACYLIDVHLGTWRHQVARFFDAVFVAQKDYVPAYRELLGHDQVFWLPLAAATDVHRDHAQPRVYDVAFVGNMALAHRGTARARRLQMIAERWHTNDWGRFYSPEEVGHVYSQARIVFNTSIAGDVTMRVFEGSACGALVLTDSVGNGLDELFDLGQELVAYAGDDDLLAKIAYYLDHEEERAKIASAGQRRTLSEHTYGHRAEVVVAHVTAPGFRCCAPMRAAGATERRPARREVYTHLHMADAILDDERRAGSNAVTKALAVLPVLARRILR